MEHFVKEFFWPRDSSESCRNMGKNLFVAEGYSLIDEERREGGTKNRSKWNLKTLLAERSTKERNKRAKTKTGLPGRLQKRRSQYIMCQSWWRNQRLNLTATHCLISIVSLVSIRYLLKTSPQQRHCQQKDLRLRSIRLITMLC